MALITVASTHRSHSPTSDSLAIESRREPPELVSVIPDVQVPFKSLLEDREGRTEVLSSWKGHTVLPTHPSLSFLSGKGSAWRIAHPAEVTVLHLHATRHASKSSFGIAELTGGWEATLCNVPHLWDFSEENRDSQSFLCLMEVRDSYCVYRWSHFRTPLRINGGHWHLGPSAETTGVVYRVLKWHFRCYSNRLSVALWQSPKEEEPPFAFSLFV